MVLEEYGRKRNPEKTPEPFLSETEQPRPIYVIQEHHASHLHWDLRLEFSGVLRSWALPKEPPIEEGVKRLAVNVEDHPISYATFKGTIPQGEYGGGTVKIWDCGTFKTLEEDDKHIIVDITGKKLKGKYALIQTNMGGKSKNWLFFKKHD
jgi:DNA ligase D-like protein (predicted 3'-phosphoesterase)